MRLASWKLGLAAMLVLFAPAGARADDVPLERRGRSALDDVRVAMDWAGRGVDWVRAWYFRTPPSDRMVWGGLVACAGLGLGVLLERLLRIRPRRVVPTDFTSRFLDRIHDGRLDCGGALDHCETNPSPAARVALAAVRRWGRPAADLERAVMLAQRVEGDRLKRNVGTLRRVAALAPLLGLLGTLFALGRALESAPIPSVSNAVEPAAWGREVAGSLAPLTVGIVIAACALVAYDGLMIRVEKLTGALVRVGAETIDAIATSAPVTTPLVTFGRTAAAAARTPHQRDAAVDLSTQARANDTVA